MLSAVIFWLGLILLVVDMFTYYTQIKLYFTTLGIALLVISIVLLIISFFVKMKK